MKVEIRRVFNENFQVYGVRKVWRQSLRKGCDIARCTAGKPGAVQDTFFTHFTLETLNSPAAAVCRQYHPSSKSSFFFEDRRQIAPTYFPGTDCFEW